MENSKNKILHWLHIIEDSGRIITIAAMTGLVFCQVMARIIFKWSSPALEEAARFIMIWSIFIGAVVTTREDSHIRMGGIFNSPKGKIWFELISKMVTFVFLCIFVVWSYEFVIYSIHKGMNSIVLGVPLAVVHACFLITGVLMAVHALVHFINQIMSIFKFYKGPKP